MNTNDPLQGARNILEPNLKVGQSLAILGSADVDWSYYDTLIGAASDMGIAPTLGLMTPRTTPGKPAPPPLLAQALEADVTILTASTSLAHSSTALGLLAAGRRAITFPVPSGPGRSIEILGQQAIYDVDKLMKVKRTCMSVAKVLDPGKRVSIKSRSGTDLTVRIDGRKTHSWYGIIDHDGHMYSAWPPGDAHVSSIEDSANGIAVIDGYISGLGIPSEPLLMRFANGRLSDIEGPDANKLQELLDASDENARVFCEVGLGTSQWQSAENSNGDKYMSGTFHLAIGANASPCFGGTEFDGQNSSNVHLDCQMVEGVRLTVDDEALIADSALLV